jgi:hypothetical protein
MGTGGSFPWVKQPELESNHSPLPSAEAKNGEGTPQFPQHVFRARYLITIVIQHSDNTVYNTFCVYNIFWLRSLEREHIFLPIVLPALATGI